MHSRTSTGWLLGLITAAVAVGVGEFVAVFVRPAASPVVAVGNRVVLLTPETAKRATIDSVACRMAPVEMPAKMPSCSTRSRVRRSASYDVTENRRVSTVSS